MIKELLEYQKKDKERLDLILSVEQGKTKRELDENTRLLNIAKGAVLALENEAQMIQQTIETVRKNLGEVLDRAEEIAKTDYSSNSEDELNSAIAYATTIGNKATGYENQLADLSRRINEKATQFEEIKSKIVRAQKNIAILVPKYEEEKARLKPQLEKIEAELKKLEDPVDKKLFERYKKLRAADKTAKSVDVVVPLVSNRCAGCRFELALSMTHRVATEGYITCEECARIIYKD